MVTPALPSIAVLKSQTFVLSFQVSLSNFGGIVIEGELAFDDVQIRVDAAGGVRLQGARARMNSVTALAPGLSLRVPSIELREVTATLAGGAVVELCADHAVAAAVRLDLHGMAIEIATATAEGGLRRDADGSLHFGSANLQGVGVVIDDLRAQLPEPPQDLSAPLHTTFGELLGEVLDRLEGHVGFQVVIGVDLPVIGRRQTTSTFDLPVVSGTVEYPRIERGLACIIDAAFDFELRGDTLVLEKDLPLIPFDNVTTLVWKLNPTELQIAQAGRVRFATLLRGEQPPGIPNNDIAQLLAFVSIDGIAIDFSVRTSPVVLAWPGGGRIVWGTTQVPPLDTFTIRGNLLCTGDAEPTTPPTRIEMGLARTAVQVDGVPLGGLEAIVGGVELHGLEVEATMMGFVPRAVSIRLGEVRLTPRA